MNERKVKRVIKFVPVIFILAMMLAISCAPAPESTTKPPPTPPEISHQLEVRLPEKQKAWEGKPWFTILQGNVSTIIPYKGYLVLATDFAGGVYRFPPLKPLYEPDETGPSMPNGRQGIYAPGKRGSLDVAVLLGQGKVIVVNPDWSVDVIKVQGMELHAGAGIALPVWNSEKAYVHFRGGHIFEVNLKERTYHKIAKAPQNLTGRRIVYRDGKLYIPGGRGSNGLWEYDIAADTWTQTLTEYRVMEISRALMGWTIYWVEEGQHSGFAFSKDFATWDFLLIPAAIGDEVVTPRHWADRWDAAAYLHGHIFRFRPPFRGWAVRAPGTGKITSMARWNGMMVLGFGYPDYQGVQDRDQNPGGLLFYPLHKLNGPLLPTETTFWNNKVISAGEVSKPVLTAGWSRKTLYFYTDTAGDLTLEVDPIGIGEWVKWDTIPNTPAGTWIKPYVFKGDFFKLRLKFSTTAKVTARLVLQP